MRHPISFVDVILNLTLFLMVVLAQSSGASNQASRQNQAQEAEHSGLEGEMQVAVQVFEDGIALNGHRCSGPAEVIALLPPNDGKHLILSVTSGNPTVTDRTVGQVARELWKIRPAWVEVTRY
ncbi:MAG TPA: hypothetical protein VJV75_04305 [Candidatus Polarisedimenticolia bacterium]|nr:hypothetical protein [Candidatus Polarisedimenticolia bacterium]